MQVAELSLSRLAPRTVEMSPTDGCMYVIPMHLDSGIPSVRISLQVYISCI